MRPLEAPMHQPAPPVRHDGTPPPRLTPAGGRQAAGVRRAMIARPAAGGPLDPAVREAALPLPLNMLISRAYVRRVADGVEQCRWCTESSGAPDVWGEVDATHARRLAVGRPFSYRLEFSGTGPGAPERSLPGKAAARTGTSSPAEERA
ncbi:hypothetical protein AB0N81_38100 [Streptomyces sp. NPDC093510]|uniref:hypothetical protein n=1 Tax=Streptomyces sp. NPDC093510 TaxID=3155199 RepID=UPI00343C16BE